MERKSYLIFSDSADAEKPADKRSKRLLGYMSPAKTAEKWGSSDVYVRIAAREGRIPGAEFIDGRWHIPEEAESPMKKMTAPKAGYISATEAAEKWDIMTPAVCRFCREGRIPGAECIDGRWHIPENAENPIKKRAAPKPGYISATKTAEKWGVSLGFVHHAVRDGRIAGAELVDGIWHIPENAENPAKKRAATKAGYISAKRVAEKWGVSRGFVCNACREGRIPGAELIDGIWHIPEAARNPGRWRGKRR